MDFLGEILKPPKGGRSISTVDFRTLSSFSLRQQPRSNPLSHQRISSANFGTGILDVFQKQQSPIKYAEEQREFDNKHPTELQKALLDFTVAFIMEKPKDIIDYAVLHFKELQNNRRKASDGLPKPRIPCSSSSSSLQDLKRPSSEVEGPRRMSVFSETFDMGSKSELPDNASRTIIPKTDKQRGRLLNAINRCIIFNSLEQEEMYHVVDALYERNVAAGEIIIREGEEGDNFYVIESGIYDVYSGCNRIDMHTFGTFGEMALLYNVVRTATVQAATKGKLWVMNRQTFRKILHKHEFQKQQRYSLLLKTTPVFGVLDKYEVTKLVDAFETRYFMKGDVVYQQGYEPKGLYFIETGVVALYVNNNDNLGNVIVHKLIKGQYFGDIALLTKSKYRKTAIADADTKCAFVGREHFERYMTKCIPAIIQSNFEEFGVGLDDEIINKLSAVLSEIRYDRLSN